MSLSVRALAPDDTMPFIKAQWQFYVDDPNWVAPMIMDRKKLLNQKVNPFYKHAEMQLFLAERDGKVVGRIAAITNALHNETHNDKVGFFGFFECQQDQGVATSLFSVAEQWLRDRGMTHIRGPVNPSMNDEAGLLVSGFNGPPVVLMTYNPSYYEQLVLGGGYEGVKDLYAYLLQGDHWMSEKMQRMLKVVIDRNKVTFRSVELKNKEGFKRDVRTLKEIYNKAWEENWGFVKMTDEEFDFLAADLKQIADKDFVFIVESKGRIAGFCLAIPDINQSLKHNRSGGTLSGVFHLLTKKKKIDLVRIIVLGLLPEYQGKGIDAAIYHEIGARAKAKGILRGEASWILEDNVMMNRGLQHEMNGDRYRTYRLYEKGL